MRPKTQYAQSGEVYVAYQVFGEGPPDLVVTATSNIEWGWEQPQLAEFLRALSSCARVILFDRRGSGASDRSGGMPTLEDRMDDVRAVMDAAESERAVLYAAWGTAATTALFAATHPQRVLALVLWVPQVRGSWAPDYPWGPRQPPRHPGAVWGADLEETLATVFPSRVGDEEFARWLETAVRVTVSPSEALHLARVERDLDARHVLPTVLAPTLVIHRGTFAPPERSAFVADRIPGAYLLDLGPGDAAPWSSDSAPVISAIREFLASAWEADLTRAPEPDRVLATILFTDIVGSTTRAVELGDAAWRDLLQRHHARVRRELLRFRGRELDTAGDGFFAWFDGPARAVKCARAIVDAGPELGLELRAGLHTGECELIDRKIAGIAVHIGARVAGQARRGEVLVSSTVRDLVAGSGLEFEDRGDRVLKGLPGAWRVFAAVPQ